MKHIGKLVAALALAIASTATWAVAQAAETCPELEPISVASLDMGSRYPQIAIGIDSGIFEKHCLDFEVLPLKTPRDASVVMNDRQVDATMTAEPVIEAYIKNDGQELPVIYGVMTYENNVVVGSVPLGAMIGKVIAIGRCPVITEHPDGTLWGDVTDPADEKYGRQPPSVITLMTFALIRQAVQDGHLPENTRIICGRGFTEGFRPEVDQPVVYVEEGQGATRRDEMLVKGSVVATTVNLDQVPHLRRLVPNLVVYPEAIDSSKLFIAGIFAYPSVFEKKPAAFCNLATALQEINSAFLAGTIADKPYTELTLDDLDEEAQRAYQLFEDVIAFDRTPNRYPGSLTLKNLNGTGIDAEATLKARLETFAELRSRFVKPQIAVTTDELRDYGSVYHLDPEMIKYQDPCQ